MVELCIAIYDYCNIAIEGSSGISFNGNSAIHSGGGIYCDHDSNIRLKGDSCVTFAYNSAQSGGAVAIIHATMTTTENSSIWFSHNDASMSGGAMYLSDKFNLSFDGTSNITYLYNSANQFGGALYGDLNGQTVNGRIAVDTMLFNFTSNTASIGPDVYIDIPVSCDDECLKSIVGDSSDSAMNHSRFSEHVLTPPSKLILESPAVPIENTSRDSYVIKNIMLGQEIILNATLEDHNNRTAVATQFVLINNNQKYQIDGPSVVLISSDIDFQGIRIKGPKPENETAEVNLTISSCTDSRSLYNFNRPNN